MSEYIAQQSAGRRAAAYWFVDGLPEIAFGVLFLAMGVAGVALGFYPKDRLIRAVFFAVSIGFVVLFSWDRKILDYIKARLTYPRTGYVRPPVEGPKQAHAWPSVVSSPPPDENVTRFRTRTVLLFFIGMQTMGWVGNLLGRGRPERWSLPVVMTAIALLEYFWNRDEERPYAWWSVVPIAAAGAVSLVWELPSKSARCAPLLIGGVWLLAHGVWNLVGYLRAHPRVAVREEVRS
jgi:hypothetical protein